MNSLGVYTNNVAGIQAQFKYLLSNKIFNPEGMLEIHGASFYADEPCIFGHINNNYIKKEIDWYMSESRNVYDMPNPPAIWKEVATSDGYINSNYGYLVFSEENNNQFQKVIRAFRQNINTRQATMIYTRPTIHQEAFANGRRDFICTNTVNYNIVDCGNSRLEVNCIVQMRSNDVVYGYKNDFAWQEYVLRKVVNELKKDNRDIFMGKIIWQVASLHIYSKHFKLVK